ncbi:MAG: CocE/NonD family hydrolase, partial [Armatimonadetes bacterium]|nr:CocE/NonD family hydrolase [Armatimonadota bacterium]
KDGYDTVQWIAAQPWCDGNVGMIGGSYGGYVQWAAAVERPSALKCIVPQVSPPDPMYNIPYSYGAFFLSPCLWWSYIVRGKTADFSKIQGGVGDVSKLTVLPLTKAAKAYLGVDIPFWEKWLGRDRPSKWDGANYQADMAKVTIPALHISGWWDGDGIGTRTNWAIMQKAGKTNQWLINGPWEHGFNAKTKFGDQEYGPQSLLELDSLYLRWFDTWLKGREIGLNSIPRVKTFATGANEWRTSSQWPANGLAEQALYLNSSKSDRHFLSTSNSQSQSKTSYKYDPAQLGDLKKMNEAADPSKATTIVTTEGMTGEELVFKTEVLKKPLEVGGPIRLDLYFKTTAKDADFFAELVDIDEKGTMRLVAMPGALRASYFGRMNNPTPLTPGKVYPITIEIWDTAHQFKAGHRLGVILNSNMFPMYNRNLGLGEPIASATKMIKAKHTILMGGNTPSRLRFYPLVAKSGAK